MPIHLKFDEIDWCMQFSTLYMYYFLIYLPFEQGMALRKNEVESPSLKNTVYKVNEKN